MRKPSVSNSTRITQQSPDCFEISMTKGRAKYHLKNKSTHDENKPDLF